MHRILLGKESSLTSSTTRVLVSRNQSQGFTIVELLIVVVVIAILAAITIVAYNGIQQRSTQSALQSSVSQTGKKVLLYAPQNSDMYPQESTFAQDLSLPASTDKATYDYYASDDRKAFCISVTDTTKVPESGYAFTQNGQTVPGRCIKNMIINPSIEGGTNGWGTNAGTGTVSTDWKATGASSIRQTPTSSSNDTFSSNGGSLGGMRLGMQAGRTYTLSGTVRLDAAQTAGVRKVRVYYKTPSSGYLVSESTGAPNQAGAVSRQATTVTLPNDATEAFVRFYNGAAQGGGDVWWDAAMLTQGSTLYTYNDPNNNSQWSWTDAPNSSASFGPALPSS